VPFFILSPRRYEQLKNLLLHRRNAAASSESGGALHGNNGGDEELSANDLFVASTASKICAILATYPYQVVRSCVQQRQVVGNDAVRYTSAGATVKHIWRLEGAGGFYRGIWAHMLRSTPQATITLMVRKQQAAASRSEHS